MKKLTKQTLDELARTMYVIPESEMDCIIGMYGNDCFWRCVLIWTVVEECIQVPQLSRMR